MACPKPNLQRPTVRKYRWQPSDDRLRSERAQDLIDRLYIKESDPEYGEAFLSLPIPWGLTPLTDICECTGVCVCGRIYEG